MECAETAWLSNEEYLKRFNKKTAQLRTPLVGSLDLIHSCNLRCVHCYLSGSTGHRLQKEMGTRGRTKALQYDWELVARKTCDLYLKVLGKSSHHEISPESEALPV